MEKIRRAVTVSAGYTNKLVQNSQLSVNFILQDNSEDGNRHRKMMTLDCIDDREALQSAQIRHVFLNDSRDVVGGTRIRRNRNLHFTGNRASIHLLHLE